jgi:hypothetical protein
MRVEKRQFAREFSQLSCPGQMKTRFAWNLMSVEKREFAWDFSQLSCPAVKREQELHESWWELASESLHESFLNSHVPVKREQELHESCMRVGKREFAWEFSQLSCPGQMRTRVAWELRSESLHESFFNSRAPVKREQELMRVGYRYYQSNEQKLIKIWTSSNLTRVNESWRSNENRIFNSHPRLIEALTHAVLCSWVVFLFVFSLFMFVFTVEV